MRFCQSFMTELYQSHRRRTPTCPPATSAWARARSAIMYGQYKRITGNVYEGVLDRQGPHLRRLAGPHGGHGLRPVLLHARRCLNCQERSSFEGKTRRRVRLPATWPSTPRRRPCSWARKVVAMCDSTGWIYDADGVDLDRRQADQGGGARPHQRVCEARAQGASTHDGQPRHLERARATSPCPAPRRTSWTIDGRASARLRTAASPWPRARTRPPRLPLRRRCKPRACCLHPARPATRAAWPSARWK